MAGPTTYDIGSDWIGDPYGIGDSPGLVATSGYSTGAMTDDGMVGGNNTPSKAPAAPKGNWIEGLIFSAVLVFVIMLLVHHLGKPTDDFKNPKASAWTVLVAGLSAAATIPLYKLAAAGLANTKLPFTAGLNTYIQAA